MHGFEFRTVSSDQISGANEWAVARLKVRTSSIMGRNSLAGWKRTPLACGAKRYMPLVCQDMGIFVPTKMELGIDRSSGHASG